MKNILLILCFLLIGFSGFSQLNKYVTKTGTQTLTNKTLTSPKINENIPVTVTATELNKLTGLSGNVQSQITTITEALSDTIDLSDALNYDISTDTALTKAEFRAEYIIGFSDSIPELTSMPTSGNIWIETDTDQLWFRSGNYWYNSQKTDSIHIASSLHTDLVSCWEANNTTFVDLKSARNGTLQGGATVTNTATHVGAYSILVNASTDYVSVADNNAYHLTGSYTISTWFNASADNVGNGAIMSVYQNNGFTAAYYIAYNRVQDATYSYRAGMSPSNGSNDVSLTDNAWHHLIVVFDETGITEYVDGIKQAKDAMTGTPSNTWGNGIQFGRFYTTNVFKGYISQTAIWSRSITDDEAATLNNSGTGKPYSEW